MAIARKLQAEKSFQEWFGSSDPPLDPVRNIAMAGCLRVWLYAVQNSEDGLLPRVTIEDLDVLIQVPMLASMMMDVRWLSNGTLRHHVSGECLDCVLVMDFARLHPNPNFDKTLRRRRARSSWKFEHTCPEPALKLSERCPNKDEDEDEDEELKISGSSEPSVVSQGEIDKVKITSSDSSKVQEWLTR